MKIKDVIGVTVFAIIIFGIIIAIYFLGIAGIAQFLDIQYDSLTSLGIFVISIFIIGFFVDLIFDGLTILAVDKLSDYFTAFIILFLFTFVSYWIVIAILLSIIKNEKWKKVQKINFCAFLVDYVPQNV